MSSIYLLSPKKVIFDFLQTHFEVKKFDKARDLIHEYEQVQKSNILLFEMKSMEIPFLDFLKKTFEWYDESGLKIIALGDEDDLENSFLCLKYGVFSYVPIEHLDMIKLNIEKLLDNAIVFPNYKL